MLIVSRTVGKHMAQGWEAMEDASPSQSTRLGFTPWRAPQGTDTHFMGSIDIAISLNPCVSTVERSQSS